MTDSTAPRRTPGKNPPRRRFGQRLLGGAGALRLQRFDGKSWVPFGNAMKR